MNLIPAALTLLRRYWYAVPILGLVIALMITRHTLERRTERLESARAENALLVASITSLKAEGEARKDAVRDGLRAAQPRVNELEVVRQRMEVLSREKGDCAVPDEVRATWEKL